jgi:N-acyl-L-homoserine lactone synthetase
MPHSPLGPLLAGLRARRTRRLREADRRLEPGRFRAVEATTDELRSAVFRLRYHLYVELMGVLAPDDPLVTGGVFRDGFDDYSTLLALFYDQALVGTLRITTSSDGPLELDSYRSLERHHRPGEIACEIQRLMVLPGYRCQAATAELLASAMRILMRRRVTQLFGAARVGNLGRLFQNLGAEVLDPSPFRFAFLPNAEYQLIGMRLGQPGTLRRRSMMVAINMWHYLARRHPRFTLRVTRRRFAGGG